MASQPTVPKIRMAAMMNFVGLVFFTVLVYQWRRWVVWGLWVGLRRVEVVWIPCEAHP